MQRLNKDEYNPYYETYISKVPDENILELLAKQIEIIKKETEYISEEKGLHKYAPDKWTIKQLLGHINDTERVFSYRALRFSRNDKTPLPGFDQDDFVNESNSNIIKINDHVEEFIKLRESNLAMFKNFSEDMWTRRGIANNNGMSVRAIPYVMYGHAEHHLRVLKEKYL